MRTVRVLMCSGVVYFDNSCIVQSYFTGTDQRMTLKDMGKLIYRIHKMW